MLLLVLHWLMSPSMHITYPTSVRGIGHHHAMKRVQYVLTRKNFEMR